MNTQKFSKALGEISDDYITGAGSYVPDKKRNRTRRIWMQVGAVAAALILVFGINLTYANFRVDSVVGIDVNPSLEISVNRNEKVLSVQALNEDAEIVLDGMDLKNVDLDVAVNAVIGSMLKNGYLDKANNAINICVENSDPQRSEALSRKLTEAVNSILSSNAVNGSVMTQTTEKNTQLEQLAKENNVSVGKAALAEQAVTAKDGALTFEDAVKMPVIDLWEIVYPESTTMISLEDAKAIALEKIGKTAGQVTFLKEAFYEKQLVYLYDLEILTDTYKYGIEISALSGEILNFYPTKLNGGNQVNTIPDGLITAEKAQEIAYADAGVKSSQAELKKCKLDEDDGEWLYEVEFRSGKNEYEYEINAKTGKILSRDMEIREPSGATSGVAVSSSLITDERALEIACSDAGVKSSQAELKKCKLNEDDGEWLYEVEFRSGKNEYEYEIDAKTGKILSRDMEIRESSGATSGVAVSGSLITDERALEIACSDAGVKSSQAELKKCKLDKDDGEWLYEVEFRSGKNEYEYEIDAKTGKILSRDMEQEEEDQTWSAGSAQPELISQEKALKYAYSKAGVSSSDVSNVRCSLDDEDGSWVYEISFRSGRSEYEYEVDAESGEILKQDIEAEADDEDEEDDDRDEDNDRDDDDDDDRDEDDD